MTARAQTPADSYDAICMLVEALQDGHSFFFDADQKQSQGSQGTPLGFGLFILSPEFVVTEVFPESAGDKAGVRRLSPHLLNSSKLRSLSGKPFADHEH